MVVGSIGADGHPGSGTVHWGLRRLIDLLAAGGNMLNHRPSLPGLWVCALLGIPRALRASHRAGNAQSTNITQVRMVVLVENLRRLSCFIQNQMISMLNLENQLRPRTMPADALHLSVRSPLFHTQAQLPCKGRIK